MLGLEYLVLKEVLLTIGLMFSNPFFPDFGLQFLVSLFIGMLLPEKIINPLNRVILKVPGVKRFEDALKTRKRLQTIVPRIIAGYFFTYVIGWSCLGIVYFLL